MQKPSRVRDIKMCQSDDRAKQDQQRDRDAEDAAVAERLDELGEARDVAAAGQELAEPAQEDHHRQRHEDGVGAGIGDDRPHHEAARRADADGQDRAEQKGDRCPHRVRRWHASTQARVSPQILAVKVMARLMPPEMIGISMASVSSPSSGNWKATESKVAMRQEARRQRS